MSGISTKLMLRVIVHYAVTMHPTWKSRGGANGNAEYDKQVLHKYSNGEDAARLWHGRRGRYDYVARMFTQAT